MRTIGELSRLAARREPSKAAFVMGDATLSFAEVEARANRLAHGLRERGVRKGERVALVADTILDYAVYSQAIAKAGAIIVPVNPRLTAAEMEHVLSDSGAKLAIAQAELVPVVGKATAGAGVRPLIASIGGSSGEADFDAAALEAGRPAEAIDPGVTPDDPASLMYTSGTTGKPKGVLYGHGAHFQLLEAQIVELDMNARDVLHVASPLFTNGGLNGGINCSLYLGITSMFHPGSFDPAVILPAIERHGVTIGFWVPTMLSILCDNEVWARHDLSSVTKIYYGSMPTGSAILEKARTVFPAARFYHLYGSTECGFVGCVHPDADPAFAHCTGREAFNTEVAFLDDDGREVAVGEAGEIAVRQRSAGMMGYWNNPEETARAIRDGWIRSGDLARREADGFFTLVGRKREMIISGAHNIYPKEIELVIASHPAVRDVAVFGIPDEKYGEAVCAAIELNPGASLDAAEVDALCLASLARYKRPRHVEFHAALPRNTMGKITKQVLRDPHWQGTGRTI